MCKSGVSEVKVTTQVGSKIRNSHSHRHSYLNLCRRDRHGIHLFFDKREIKNEHVSDFLVTRNVKNLPFIVAFNILYPLRNY